MREYSMEATAGKNPVNHTGKLYNAVALLAADRIVKEVKGVKEAYVRILSRIGNAIDNPQIASAAVVLDRPARISQVRPEIESILNESLNEIRGVTKLILEKRIILF
jgi:S-adenosylmethionine synthetase